MRIKVMVLCAAAMLTTVCRGAGVRIEDAPDWKPATAEQVAVLKKQHGANVVDFSMFSNGGAGSTIFVEAHMLVGREFAEGSAVGYEGGLKKGGYTLVHKEPAAI